MELRPIIIAVILIITTLSLSNAEDLTIHCLYEPNKSFSDDLTATFLTCNLKSNLSSTTVVREAIGEPGTTLNSDVAIFEVKEMFIQRIPKGLMSVFTNLVGIKVTETEFNYLIKDDLDEYGAIKYLDISFSKLHAILSDTFTSMSSLEYINLSGNQITFIGPNSFNNLNSLTFLGLEIVCLLGKLNVARTATEVTALKVLVDQNCNDPENLDLTLINLMKNYVEALDASQSCIISNPEEHCPSDCEDELTELKEMYDNQTLSLNTCNSNIETLTSEKTELEHKVEEFEALTSNFGDGTCGYKTVSDVYTCYARITVKSAADQTVNWTGTHETGKDAAAVNSLVIYSQIVHILPNNIGTSFTNLKSLAVKNSRLTSIKSDDFKTLSNLETLEITGNNISTIDATAFAGLNKLSVLNLSANKITSLPSKVFESLAALKVINLSDNFLKIKYDVISSSNRIEEIYLRNNNAILPLDRTFVWRLQYCIKIDLSGTGCDYSLDKTQPNSGTFMTFYNRIAVNC